MGSWKHNSWVEVDDQGFNTSHAKVKPFLAPNVYRLADNELVENMCSVQPTNVENNVFVDDLG